MATRAGYRLAEITERTPKGYSQRFKCGCGKVHLLGCYVFAHYNDKLLHTCACGRKNIVQSGVVQTPINAPRNRRPRRVSPPHGCMRHVK